jgi:hypothetical protein
MCGISAYFNLQQKKDTKEGNPDDANGHYRHTAAKLEGRPFILRQSIKSTARLTTIKSR